MNKLQDFANVFDGIKPWAGKVPKGYLVDFLGVLTDAKFREMFGVNPATTGGTDVETRLPRIEDGEGWFETANWILAARAARDRFVMVTLGACYGAQAVGSCRAMQLLNPMPYKLVAVEPEPENYEWTRRHMRDNGINPDDQWLVKSAISARNDPVLFPDWFSRVGRTELCCDQRRRITPDLCQRDHRSGTRSRRPAQPNDDE